MAVCPIPEQWEYVHGNGTERNANESLVLVNSGNFHLDSSIEILPVLIAVLGLVGNSIVLWLLGFRIQRNPFSVYVLNLTGADSLFLSFSLLSSILTLHDFFMYIVRKYLRYIFYNLGLSLLAGISTKRCLSVLFPIWYQCHLPKHTSAAMCTLLWALTSLVGVTDFVVCFCVYIHFCHEFFIIEVVWFILFTFVLCGTSLTLLLWVQCSSQRRQPPRLYVLVLLTVLVFLLCGLPMGIEDFLLRSGEVFKSYCLCELLASVNSRANPFIYFFEGSQSHKRRAPLSVVLQRALGDQQELEDGMRNTPHPNIQETSDAAVLGKRPPPQLQSPSHFLRRPNALCTLEPPSVLEATLPGEGDPEPYVSPAQRKAIPPNVHCSSSEE
ncbi:mas-related G-protein coupled receptor member X1-like [Notamacropus eugenii]|uniref:mas-related G-protein coupled receptor member X1-like n=1 Tax=Notamacropus eugenii TaxID=9315 RepID=UPI003B6837CC